MHYPRYYTYIITNWSHTVLYTGMTSHLGYRLIEHWAGKKESFTDDTHAYYLLWFEETKYVLNAIEREKEIKHQTRAQKEQLIASTNPDWRHLNKNIIGNWPPTLAQVAEMRLWRHQEDANARSRSQPEWTETLSLL